MGAVAGLVIGIAVGIVVVLIRRKRFRRNFPDEETKVRLVAALLNMKQCGSSYSERLRFLRENGLRRDVADVLLGEAERRGSQL